MDCIRGPPAGREGAEVDGGMAAGSEGSAAHLAHHEAVGWAVVRAPEQVGEEDLRMDRDAVPEAQWRAGEGVGVRNVVVEDGNDLWAWGVDEGEEVEEEEQKGDMVFCLP